MLDDPQLVRRIAAARIRKCAHCGKTGLIGFKAAMDNDRGLHKHEFTETASTAPDSC
jgi:hypothetical protein